MAKKEQGSPPIETHAAPWSDVVLVCEKCLRRQDREDLRRDLRKALKEAGRRDVRTVLVGCLDLCPDDGVTVARGSQLTTHPPQLHVLPNRTPVDALVRWVVD